MAFKSLSKYLIIGISLVTIMNTLVLFSCRFSESGCPLSNNFHDTSRHLPVPSTEYKRQMKLDSKELLQFQAKFPVKTKTVEPHIAAVDQTQDKLDKPETKDKVSNEYSYQDGKNEDSFREKEAEGQTKDGSDPDNMMSVADYKNRNHNDFKPEDYVIGGRIRPNKAFLVIGVPSVKRVKANYLTHTLRELVDGLDESEKEEVLILVFATDFDPSAVMSIVDEVSSKFQNELNSGLIRIIKAPRSFYPNLDKLPQLWGDKPERVYWRSKQSLDYAFLFKYAKDLGRYYMQIEDDVSISNGYLKKIKDFIQRHETRKWSILEFGARGFIGMMYRTSDLEPLSKFVKMFYWVAPIDLLFRQFNDFHLYGNPQWPKLNPPLFRHVGTFSSLNGQVRRLEDIKGEGRRLYKDSNNPDAEVTTSIRQSVRHSKIKSAYDTLYHGAFWGTNIKKGDNIIVHFTKATKITKLIVESGGARAPEDYFGGAKILHATENEDGECEDYYFWKEFLDMPQLRVQSAKGIVCNCVKIEVTKLRRDRKGSVRWLAVREIAIWTTKLK